MAENRKFKGKTKSYARVDPKTGRIVKWVSVKGSVAQDKAKRSMARKRRRYGHRGD